MMHWFRNLSIQRKVTLVIMAASTSALLLLSASFVAYELITFRQWIRRDMSSLAELVGNQSTAALTYEDPQGAQDILQTLSGRKRIIGACLYKGGKPFARYPAANQGNPLPDRPEPEGFRSAGDQLVLFQEIKLAGEPVGTIALASNLDDFYQRLSRYAGILALFISGALLVTYLISLLLQRVISKPISHLAQTAKTISAEKNYAVRAHKGAEDEMGQLIDEFNEMLGQIQQRDTALRHINDKLEKRFYERTQDLHQEIVERKRAEEALQEQLTRIRLLNQITRVISDRQDLGSIVQVVLRQLEDQLAIRCGVFCLFDGPSRNLTVTALRAQDADSALALNLPEGEIIPVAQTELEPCLQGNLVYLPDTSQSGAAFGRRFAAAGLKALIGIPLMAEASLIGVLLIARARLDAFSQGEQEFVRTLGEHVALAAHQAQLHTELQQAYNDLRQTQQTVMQQERLKALGQMASGIAHDINNALSPVIGFADLLARSEKDLSEQGKKYLQFIKTAGEDIAHIVARLREFYRRRGQRESLTLLSLNRVTEQVVDMTRPRWRDIPQGRGLMVEMETDFEANPPQMLGNESELREALTNLILNAVDALPHGGKITVRTRSNASLSAAADGRLGPHAILEVIDNGIGMDELTRQHCLEPFFSTKGKRGTGMGLAMVYGVVERHEGKIEIETEVGKGSTFRLIFPIRKSATPESAPKDQAITPKPLQILCIDDEPLLRELLKELLESDGHRVEVTDGGQAGLKAFRAAHQRGSPFDVVITDLGMPYLDGRQVAKTLKREVPGIPIILLTGWGAFMREDGELPPEIDSVLSKPPRARELREILHRLTQPGEEATLAK